MGIVRYWLAGAACALTVAGSIMYSIPDRFASAAVQYGLQAYSTPEHVLAGVPFVLHDGSGSQVCISSRAGRPLSPYVLPMSTVRFLSPQRIGQIVHPGIPVVLHDGYATLICISSYAGVTLAPFITR
jgi:hypothetical protein